MKDVDEDEEAKEREGVDVDNDALAYIRARKTVMTLAAAKKIDKWLLILNVVNLSPSKLCPRTR